MPSSNITAFIGLNQWSGTDKPKKDDFNSDNFKVDEALKNHVENSVTHVTSDEKALWNANTFITGTFVGNGVNGRAINLGFKPRFGFVYAVDYAPIMADRANSTDLYFGFFTPLGCSKGVRMDSNGFIVNNAPDVVPYGIPFLNTSGVTYVYVVCK